MDASEIERTCNTRKQQTRFIESCELMESAKIPMHLSDVLSGILLSLRTQYSQST